MTDEIPVVEGEVFRPRFDTPDKDRDRLMEFTVELLHAGKITREPGLSLDETHIAPAFEKVIDAYFDRELYAELEAYFTCSECYNLWPYEGELERWRRLAERGQQARVIRLWRNHLACMKPGFWYRIAERNKGYRKPKFSGMSDASDRRSYENLIAQIPRMKEDILGVMALARHWFEYMNVPQAQLKRLQTERAEIEAEERRRPEGKPDPRAMEPDVFWEVIGAVGDHSVPAHVEAVVARLEQFKATAIKAFDAHLQELNRAAYRNDIWALAYLLYDGCSDDSFAAFRCWLILQGQEVFEATLADPNNFDIGLFRTHFEGAIALLDAPLIAYDARSGKAMKRKYLKLGPLGGDDLDEDAFEDLLPGIAEKLSASRAPIANA